MEDRNRVKIIESAKIRKVLPRRDNLVLPPDLISKPKDCAVLPNSPNDVIRNNGLKTERFRAPVKPRIQMKEAIRNLDPLNP